jgi:hypothetical protein
MKLTLPLPLLHSLCLCSGPITNAADPVLVFRDRSTNYDTNE